MSTELGPIAEVAGHEPQGVPLTADQAFYLRDYIDPYVERLIAGLEMEQVRRRESDNYQRRTIRALR